MEQRIAGIWRALTPRERVQYNDLGPSRLDMDPPTSPLKCETDSTSDRDLDSRPLPAPYTDGPGPEQHKLWEIWALPLIGPRFSVRVEGNLLARDLAERIAHQSSTPHLLLPITARGHRYRDWEHIAAPGEAPPSVVMQYGRLRGECGRTKKTMYEWEEPHSHRNRTSGPARPEIAKPSGLDRGQLRTSP